MGTVFVGEADVTLRSWAVYPVILFGGLLAHGAEGPKPQDVAFTAQADGEAVLEFVLAKAGL